MLKATVTGRIWSTKKLGEVPTGSILEIVADGRIVTGSSPSIRWAAATANGSSWRRAPSPPHGFPASRRPSMR